MTTSSTYTDPGSTSSITVRHEGWVATVQCWCGDGGPWGRGDTRHAATLDALSSLERHEYREHQDS